MVKPGLDGLLTATMIDRNDKRGIVSILWHRLQHLPDFLNKAIGTIGREQILVIFTIMRKVICFIVADKQQSGLFTAQVGQGEAMGKGIISNRRPGRRNIAVQSVQRNFLHTFRRNKRLKGIDINAAALNVKDERKNIPGRECSRAASETVNSFKQFVNSSLWIWNFSV